MVAAGFARRPVFSYLGNPGVGFAGATGLPFFPLRSYAGSDLLSVNPAIRTVEGIPMIVERLS